jgi:hypothetical protein
MMADEYGPRSTGAQLWAPTTDARIDEKLAPVLHTLLRRNPGESELHQAVRDMLGTLGPVVAKHPDCIEGKLLERICEPERQIMLAQGVI